MAATRKPTIIRKSAPKRNPRAPTIKQQQAKFDRYNQEWAEGILRSPEDHLPYMIATARSVLKRLEGKRCPGPQMPLPITTED